MSFAASARRSVTSASRVCRAGAIAALLAAPGVAWGAPGASASDLETARALFKEGKELRARGELRAAVEKLRSAHTIGRTPVTGLELARTQVLAGELVAAREVCLGVARLAVEPDETERSGQARADAATLARELASRIPSLKVSVTGAPKGHALVVEIDGEVVPAELLGEPRKLDPGWRKVVVRADGAPVEARAVVELAEGETRTVALAFPELPPAPAPEQPPRRGPDGVVFGAGFALVPHLFLPATLDAPDTKPFVGAFAGAQLEIGHELDGTIELLVRATVAFGDRAKPAYFVAVGPAVSVRVGERLWLGGTITGGRAMSRFHDMDYDTDIVLGGALEVAYAVLSQERGQWLIALSPGYLFANARRDHPIAFAPISFSYRAF